MPDQSSFDYAVLRLVPRVEREEFINAGVIVYCRQLRFLSVSLGLDEPRVKALWPEADLGDLRCRLEAFQRIAAGDPDAGPIAQLTQSERFYWLAAPRSTIIQVSPIHSGLCRSPKEALDTLCQRLLAATTL
ncbi:DUF3037 domain-containing protein [Paludibaculum fermentans]|uniref:DUF3037 domain-containing protein n=1 Tax=Paludibaculum fermentans TaxID=1473598 RepID=UPI003EB6F72C